MSDNNIQERIEEDALDISEIEDLETDEIIKEYIEKQKDEFFNLLIWEIKYLKKQVKRLKKKLGKCK